MIVTGSLCHAGGPARPVPRLCIRISPGPWPPVLPGDKINDTPFTALPYAQITEWQRHTLYLIKTVARVHQATPAPGPSCGARQPPGIRAGSLEGS